MKKIIILLASTLLVICGCADQGKTSEICSVSEVLETLPVTGTFINLPYQDVRNKYTNPQHLDYTDPDMWKTKIAEMKKMGIEYLIFMSVANEGKSYYPSRLMGKNYPEWRKSPVKPGSFSLYGNNLCKILLYCDLSLLSFHLRMYLQVY